MVVIRKKLVSDALAAKVTNGKGNTKRKVVVHGTDNYRTGSDADAHSRLQANGNSRSASWHWQVDCKEAVQSFEHKWQCWAAGTSKGNSEGIHVEMCVNSDGNYKKTLENTAALIAKILNDEQLTINDVVQHNHYSGKNCPREIRSGNIPWSEFLKMIQNAGVAQAPKPVTDTNKYRVMTGTYGTLQAAENALDVLKHRFGWVAYIEPDNKLWRVKTGTFTGMDAAQVGANKIKTAKLAQVTNIIAV